MPLAQVIDELLATLEDSRGEAVFGFDELEHWGEDVRDFLVASTLLTPTTSARILHCIGCEERCLSDITFGDFGASKAKPFIVCEVPEKQANMGRIAVNPDRLQCWKSSIAMLATFIARQLDLDDSIAIEEGCNPIRIGMLPGPNGRRWITLRASPLVVELNQEQVPVRELMFVERGEIHIDKARLQYLLAKPKPTSQKPYQSNTAKREARKLATSAMYQDWFDEYQRLLKEKPGHSKSWYAGQIARMPIACGRDVETVRKRLP